MIRQNMRISKEFEEFGPVMVKIFAKKNVPHWYDMLKQAYENLTKYYNKLDDDYKSLSNKYYVIKPVLFFE